MPKTIREAVAVFDTAEALDAAVFALDTRGFDRTAFSLLASEEAVTQKLGHRYQQVKEVEDDPDVYKRQIYRSAGELGFSTAPTMRKCSSCAYIKKFSKARGSLTLARTKKPSGTTGIALSLTWNDICTAMVQGS